MRVGIFGGSFDPPHIGHLLVAQDAIAALALDQLIVVPTGTQPLKRTHRTAAGHRLAMVQRCFDGVPHSVVDPVEVDRGGLSFMVDTVEHIQRRYPLAALHLLIGTDVVPTLPHWREPERLLTMVSLVILDRADQPDDGSSALPYTTDVPSGDAIPSGLASARHLAIRRIDVSSTEIRARVGSGLSIRGFVPDAVASYIASTALYLGERVTEVDPVRA
ncbi:MAG TPA: nicotinate (nicotinamide) nucleotide adenylyltransferase [Gemmatimonas sp.]|nr:nicotinate (nicotinamide) nucleotide adenylyltransferase [Gemmatimonas sp.]